jgi:hypothetical protein
MPFIWFLVNLQNDLSCHEFFYLLFFVGFTLTIFLNWFFLFHPSILYRLEIIIFIPSFKVEVFFGIKLRDFLWFLFYLSILVPSLGLRVWRVSSIFFSMIALFKFNIYVFRPLISSCFEIEFRDVFWFAFYLIILLTWFIS